MNYIVLYTNFLRLGIFLCAVYAYFLVNPVFGIFIAVSGVFSFLFRLRSPLLLPVSRRASYWELAMVFLILVDAIALAAGFYGTFLFGSFDIPMHIMGGAIVGWWASLAFQKELRAETLKRFMLIVAFAALIGVAWECFEWSFDHTIGVRFHLPSAQSSNNDTMKDLGDDLLGGIIVGLFVLYKKERA